MASEIIFLGGAGEIGASSIYCYLEGAGILIDAGLHPKYRDKRAFPDFELIKDKPLDLLILTHAHTDHMGGIPYLLKYHPHVKIITSRATRDLAEIMLKDTAKLLKSEIRREFSEEDLSLYKKENIDKVNSIIEGLKFRKPYKTKGRAGLEEVKIILYPSGHILGAASVYLEWGGKNLLHTSDINLRNQSFMSRAILPGHHIDYLITETTNAAAKKLPDYNEEKKRFASFINRIADKNGSVLIPSFALGKTQEILTMAHNLMGGGKISSLPIYSAGLARRISKVYDKYCYYDSVLNPGFEVSDVDQEKIYYDKLFSGKYFKESSIVIVTSGMINKQTLSYRLSEKWFPLSNYGIAFVGYQDEDSPGHALLNSEPGREFDFGGKIKSRKCEVENFRFTSHARPEDIVDYIRETKPSTVFLVHGEPEAVEKFSYNVSGIFADLKVSSPLKGEKYFL